MQKTTVIQHPAQRRISQRCSVSAGFGGRRSAFHELREVKRDRHDYSRRAGVELLCDDPAGGGALDTATRCRAQPTRQSLRKNWK